MMTVSTASRCSFLKLARSDKTRSTCNVKVGTSQLVGTAESLQVLLFSAPRPLVSVLRVSYMLGRIMAQQ